MRFYAMRVIVRQARRIKELEGQVSRLLAACDRYAEAMDVALVANEQVGLQLDEARDELADLRTLCNWLDEGVS